MNSDSNDKDKEQQPAEDAPEQLEEGMPTGDTPTEDTVLDEQSEESPDAPEEGGGALGVMKGPRFAMLGLANLSPAVRAAAIIVLLGTLSLMLALAGYMMFGKPGAGEESFSATPDSLGDGAPGSVSAEAGMMELTLYYPVDRRIYQDIRKVPEASKSKAIAEAVVMEFLKGYSSGEGSLIPRGAALIDVFIGSDGILYLNFTSSMSLNFQGDALGEFLLLRALYKSVNENVYGISGVKVLIEGVEAETVGGHITLKGTLGDVVSYSLTQESK